MSKICLIHSIYYQCFPKMLCYIGRKAQTGVLKADKLLVASFKLKLELCADPRFNDLSISSFNPRQKQTALVTNFKIELK